ncbi:hypothetical protein FJZ21_03365 [Candidatus Pacearchaeota archaeon]|nr:hypothetical protein [Candidatus Pacearchaeota archaeon]
MSIKSGLSSTEEVLLAAFRLSTDSLREFTEWDLTVESWKLNKNRWGLQGHEEYPDHKRVMNEVMARGTQKIVSRGWIERTRPNHYKITQLGLVKAKSLLDISQSEKRNVNLYEAISVYVKNPIFESYFSNKSLPENWLDVASFLKLNKYDIETLNKILNYINNIIRESLNYLEENKIGALIRGKSSQNKPITKERIIELEKFIKAVEEKFKSQFDAIRQNKK